MVVGNSIRVAIWAILIVGGYFLGAYITTMLNLECPVLVCLVLGAILLAVTVRASAVTGRYLRVYGGENPNQKFSRVVRLVDKGPHSCMRHPMHQFLSLTPIAIGLLISNPGLAFIIGPLEAAVILAMAVTVDEKESIERFGEAYLEHRRKVPAISLNPKCLWEALAKMPSDSHI